MLARRRLGGVRGGVRAMAALCGRKHPNTGELGVFTDRPPDERVPARGAGLIDAVTITVTAAGADAAAEQAATLLDRHCKSLSADWIATPVKKRKKKKRKGKKRGAKQRENEAKKK